MDVIVIQRLKLRCVPQCGMQNIAIHLPFFCHEQATSVHEQGGTMQAVGAGKQRSRAEQWRQAQLLRAVVLAWEAHTCYKLDRQRLHRKAVRHRSLP